MHALMDGMMQSDGGFDRVGEWGVHVGPMGIVGMVLCVILWAALVTTLVLLIIALVRRLRLTNLEPPRLGTEAVTAQAEQSAAQSEALRILQERYAHGEMGHEEYLERRGDLTSS
jgi:putative membrane protein